MYENYNKQALAMGKQFTDNVIKAQGIVLKSFEQVSAIQAKALEEHANAQTAFANEVGKAKDFDAVRELWVKSVDFSRDSAEKMQGTQQDVLEVVQKHAEKLGEMAREQLEAGTDAIAAAPKAAKKSK